MSRKMLQSYSGSKYGSFTSTKSRESEYGALDFLCDMCQEVQEVDEDLENDSLETSQYTPSFSNLLNGTGPTTTASSQNNSSAQKGPPRSTSNRKLRSSSNLLDKSTISSGEELSRTNSNTQNPVSKKTDDDGNSGNTNSGISNSSRNSNVSNKEHSPGPLTHPITNTETAFSNESVPSSSVPMHLTKIGNRFHLVPENESDALIIANMISHATEPQYLTVAVRPCIVPTVMDAKEVQELLAPASSTQSPAGPKHIYKTSCDTYRVQVGKGSKRERNGKFSRNARSELDALWLCELALVIIDCPPTLDDIIRGGNYRCMQAKGIVLSPHDFGVKLLLQSVQMRQRGLLKAEEAERAMISLRSVLPSTVLSFFSGHVEGYAVANNGSLSVSPIDLMNFPFAGMNNSVNFARQPTTAALGQYQHQHPAPHGMGLFAHLSQPANMLTNHPSQESQQIQLQLQQQQMLLQQQLQLQQQQQQQFGVVSKKRRRSPHGNAAADEKTQV